MHITHTHIYIYIHVYVYVCMCVFWVLDSSDHFSLADYIGFMLQRSPLQCATPQSDATYASLMPPARGSSGLGWVILKQCGAPVKNVFFFFTPMNSRDIYKN